ncbi:MAG: hypothetical protein R3F19_04395 [Verrucomicrobiales bacterium]
MSQSIVTIDNRGGLVIGIIDALKLPGAIVLIQGDDAALGGALQQFAAGAVGVVDIGAVEVDFACQISGGVVFPVGVASGGGVYNLIHVP